MALRYFVPGGTNTWISGSNTNWSDTSGGAGGLSFPQQNDDVIFDTNSGSVINLSGTGQCRSIVATTFTGTFQGGTNLQVVGSNTGLQNSGKSIEWGAGMTYSYAGQYTVTTTNGSGSINFNGKTHGAGLISLNAGTTNHPISVWNLLNPITTGGQITLAAGTLNTNNYNITCTRFDFGNNALTKIANFGTSVITLTIAGGAMFNNPSTGGLVINGTYTIRYNGIGSSTLSFFGGGATFYNVEFIRGSSTAQLTITGNNTFRSFTITSTAAHTVSFATGSTQTFENFNVSGASTSARISLAGSAGATVFFVKTGAGPVVCDYLNLNTNITSVTPANTWYAGYNSIGTGTGWVLRNPAGLLLMGVGG